MVVIKIKPKFTKETIEKLIRGKWDKLNRAYFARLEEIGEKFVKNARENGNYQDRTGNLRNSIGYVILKDGKPVVSNFYKHVRGNVKKVSESDGELIGIAKAEELTLEWAAKIPKGYVLICVAGMHYAAAVEAKGFDVLSSSSIIAKQDLIKAIDSLYQKSKKI